MFEILNNQLVLNAGLNKLVQKAQDDWIGPAFFIMVAGLSLVFIKNRQFRELLAFLGIAIVVGVLIFFARDLFGRESHLVKTAKEAVGNTIDVVPSEVEFKNLLEK